MYARRIIAVLALSTVAIAGCSSDEQDSISSQVESAATDVSSAVDDAASQASNALDEAATDVSSAVDDAVTAVSSAADEASTDAAEVVARNIAAEQGAAAFEDAGYPLDGGLTCEATAGADVEAVEIDCTGTTTDGGKASLTGTTSEMPGASATTLNGDFTGTVDGTEAFTSQSLGG
jgi:hypothetical protein